MRFMVIGRATKETEAGVLPPPEAFAAMQKYNEDLVKRAPNISPDGEAEMEIRKLWDLEDFGDEFTPNPEIAKVKIG